MALRGNIQKKLGLKKSRPGYDFAVVGAGNVGWHMAQHLEQVGHRIRAVYSRRKSHAEGLCQRLYNAQAQDRLGFFESEAEIVLLCVPDDSLPEVVSKIQVPGEALVLHTSGSRPLSDLQPLPNPRGVLYPLQTFSIKRGVDFRRLPLLVEANHPVTLEALADLAYSLSSRVFELDSEKRKRLHAAAVMASNFSNHLYYLAENYLQDQQLDFELLAPLLRETLEKALEYGPYYAQTGPAVRGDDQTIAAHLELLNQHPDLQQVYKLMSDSIRRRD